MPHGSALNRTTDATSEPITTAEAKKHLNVTDAFTEDDDYIDLLVEVARIWVEDYCSVALINQTWNMKLDAWPSDGVICLYPTPLASVSSVKYEDTAGDTQTLVSGTDYQTDLVSVPGRILTEPDVTWPTLESGRLNAIEVIFVAGYGATAASVPIDFTHAIKLLVGHWYEHREEASDGKPPQSIPMGVKALLSHHRIPLA